MQLIPAIDLRDGRCVRLYQGDFAQETRYAVDPIELASDYAALGSPWLHVVDLDGAASGQPQHLELVARIHRAANLSIQLGGGIRTAQDLEAAAAVAQRIVVGSLAVKNPVLVAEWLETLGGERLVLALDVRLGTDGVPRVATHGWTRGSTMSVWDAIDRFLPHGLIHVLCTDVARDGALSGPNLDLYSQFMEYAPSVRVQASGGIRNGGDLARLAKLGVGAAISGKALLEGHLTKEEIRPYLRSE